MQLATLQVWRQVTNGWHPWVALCPAQPQHASRMMCVAGHMPSVLGEGRSEEDFCRAAMGDQKPHLVRLLAY